jgi:hypothetical protein
MPPVLRSNFVHGTILAYNAFQTLEKMYTANTRLLDDRREVLTGCSIEHD